MKLVLFITIFLTLEVFGNPHHHHGKDDEVLGSPHHHHGKDDKKERIRQGLFLYNNEKCLIGLAKVCQLKDFCRDPEDEGLNVVIIGRDKIQGEICPDVGDNIKNVNATQDVLEDCRRCSYCENEGEQRRIGVCFACHDQEGAIKEAVQVEADIQCEESYWKRFEGKRSYYHDKHPHGHSHEKMKEIVEEVEELGIEGNERQARYAHYLQKMCDEKFKNSGPKMTIDKCQSTCDVLGNVPRNK